MFMDVYHMCLDTIFMCYICDEEDHDGVAKFADENTKTFIRENGRLSDAGEEAQGATGV
jgi:hypothetical protein